MPTNKKTNSSLAKTIASVRNAYRDKKQPVIPKNAITASPETSSIVSKLIKDDTGYNQRDRDGNRTIPIPDIQEIKKLSDERIIDINDAEVVMQLLPDIKLSCQILVSSILSPKNAMDVEVIHKPPMDIFPPSTTSKIVSIIRELVSDDYKIEEELPVILRDCLFMTGSYPVLVIPENSLDDLINRNRFYSSESIKDMVDTDASVAKPLGILGPIDKDKEKNRRNPFLKLSKEDLIDYSLESIDPYIKNLNNPTVEINGKEVRLSGSDSKLFTVTDNMMSLSIPSLERHVQKRILMEKLGSVSVESYQDFKEEKISHSQIEQIIYPETRYKTSEVVKLNSSEQTKRPSVGEPMIIHLPSEAVIPVHPPSSPEDPIGYFIVIDQETGAPVSRHEDSDLHRDMVGHANSRDGGVAHELIARADNMYNGSNVSYRERYNYSSRVYGQLIESELIERIRNGIYKKTFKIGFHEQIYRVMFNRALKQMRTQLLFVPSEMMSYYAFNIDKNGIGYSLLDKMKVINALSIHLLLARTRATVMNSVQRTRVNVTLDADDPQPELTRDTIVTKFLENRSNGHGSVPFHLTNPHAIEQWAATAGIEFSFSGAEGMPDVSIDIDDFNSNVPEPDQGLFEDLGKYRANAFGLTPEIIDQTLGIDFATAFATSSLFFARRVVQYQNAFAPKVSDHVRKMVIHSPKTWNTIVEAIMEDLPEIVEYSAKELTDTVKSIQENEKAKRKYAIAFATNFMNRYEISFPRPDSLSIENKVKAFEIYEQGLDNAIEYWLTSEILAEANVGENLSELMDFVKSNLKASYMRRWMIENDFMPELHELVQMDEEGKPVYDVHSEVVDHSKTMAQNIAELIKLFNNIARSTDAYMTTQELTEVEADGGSSDYGSSDDSGDDSGGDDDFGFGGDDDGFGDFSMDDGASDNNDGDGDKKDDGGDGFDISF